MRFCKLKRTPKARQGVLILLITSTLVASAGYALGETGRIAFTSNRDGVQAIYIMNADGSAPRKLTNGSGASWSPDGKRLVFSFGLDRFHGDFSDICVIDVDGKNRVNLTKGRHKGNKTPAWSPDGEKIAFMSNRSGQTNIYVMDTDGKNTLNLTQDLNFASSPNWSPDGKKIVFASDGDIFVMDSKGANRINLTQNPRAKNLTPNWSPDGKKIAYSASPKPGLWFAPFNIYVMKADGTHPRMLTEDRRWAYEYWPCWSPDGSRIVFGRQEPDGTYDIYVINADGGGITNLTRTPRVGDHSASWIPSVLSVPRTHRLTTSWGALKRIRFQ